MSELNRFFPNILLGYMSDDGCHLTREDCNELSKFVSGLEIEIFNMRNQIASEPVRIAAKDTAENKRPTARIAELEAGQRWVPVGERLPTAQRRVMAFYKTDTGKARYELACYIPPKSVLSEDFLDSDYCDGVKEYDEENDCYWVVEGWWESSWEADTNWKISENVTHWRPLPQPPAREVE